jgi:hypothetical protein
MAGMHFNSLVLQNLEEVKREDTQYFLFLSKRSDSIAQLVEYWPGNMNK